jgi:hypothetical protein
MSRTTALGLALVLVAACAREEPARSSTEPAADSMASPMETVGGLQARRTDVGLVADLLSATRQRDSLTVTIRFRNAGSDSIAYTMADGGGGYPAVRLTAGGRDWPLAREPDGDPAAPRQFEASLGPSDSQLWRATFQAPPRSVGTFDLEMPGVERFSDVPIEDEEE